MPMTKSENQMTLGGLIEALRKQPKDHSVNFDFCMLTPGSLESYRGYYEDLALDFDPRMGFGDKTVAKLLGELEAAMSQTFEGYKGGDYPARSNTPMWVAHWGDTGGTAIVGVEDKGHWTCLKTDSID